MQEVTTLYIDDCACCRACCAAC